MNIFVMMEIIEVRADIMTGKMLIINKKTIKKIVK